MENMLIILALWLQAQDQRNTAGEYESAFTDFVCERLLQKECGIHPNPNKLNSTWLDCGGCPGHQMCGADYPESDGTFKFGTEGQCGGGCAETKDFSCDQGVAVVCSRLYNSPQEGCKMVKDGANENILTNKSIIFSLKNRKMSLASGFKLGLAEDAPMPLVYISFLYGF